MNKTTEALKLAEEAAEFARNMCLGMNWSTDLPDEALAAIRKALAEPVKHESVVHYKKALDAWFEKTEWVQETAKPKELGMHRADVLKQRINELEKQIAAPVSAKREWVDLTVSDLDAIIEKHYDDEMDLKAMILDGIAAFKGKNK